MEVTLRVPATVDEAVVAVRFARDALIGSVHPYIVLPSAQLSQGWLLAIAFPSWAVADTLVVLDLRALDARLYVEPAPSTITLQVLLRIARVSDGSNVCVYIDDGQEPIRADTEYPVRTGTCICFCRRGTPRPAYASLAQVLSIAEARVPHPVVLPTPAGRHLCIVCDHGQEILSFAGPEVTPSPMALPSLLGAPSGSRLCIPTQPLPDVELQGKPCTAVLAIVEPPQDQNEPCACLVDARGLLQGWMLFHFGEEGLLAEPLYDLLSTFMPPYRYLHIDGADFLAGYFCCRDGHVLGATFEPESPPAGSEASDQEDDDSDPGQDSDRMHLDPGPNSGDSGTGDGTDSSSERSRTPRRNNTEAVDECHHPECDCYPKAPRLRQRRRYADVRMGSSFLLFLFGTVVPSTAVQLRPAIGDLRGDPSPLGLPPALRSPAGDDRTDKDKDTDRVQSRAIPTPCRGRRRGEEPGPAGAAVPQAPVTCIISAIGHCASSGSGVQRRNSSNSQPPPEAGSTQLPLLHTLLEESLQAETSTALFMAVTLLETLSEHFRQTPIKLALLDLVTDAPTPTPHPHCARGCAFWRDLSHVVAAADWTTCDLPALHSMKGGEPVYLGPLSIGINAKQVVRFLQPRVRWEPFGIAACALPQVDLAFLSRCSFSQGEFESDDLHCFTDGSYFPPKGDKPAVMAWSCVFVCPVSGAAGVVSGVVPPFFDAGCQAAFAFVAECCALASAVWISITSLHHKQVCIRSDCQAALGILQGKATGGPGRPGSFLRSIGILSRTFGRYPPKAAYVPGHRGRLGNEVADRIAKFAGAGHSIGSGPWSSGIPAVWLQRDCAAIGWCGPALQSLQGSTLLPPPRQDLEEIMSQGACGGGLHLVAPFLPAQVDAPDGQGTDGSLRMRFCSFNVLSLNSVSVEGRASDGLAFQPARPALLASSLTQAGVHVCFVQEARTEVGVLSSSGFLRYASGAINGTLGTEIWVREGFPFLQHPRDPAKHFRFQREAFCVLHKDPRRLFLLFCCAPVKLLLVSLHAPHRATAAEIICAWWQETQQLVLRHGANATVIIGADCNAAVGSTLSEAIGGHDAERVDESSDCLASFLSATAMWLPCTFSEHHEGPSGTYVQKRSGALTRIDYIVCPNAWRNGRISTWTAPSVHAGQTYVDHIATILQVSLRLCVDRDRSATVSRGFDAQAMLTPEGRARVKEILCHAPSIPWSVNPHAHAAQLVDYLQGALHEAFPKVRRTRFRHYLSDDTWALREEVGALRRQCARLKQAVRFHFLAAAFQAWRRQDAGPLFDMLASAWTREAWHAEATQGRYLGVLARRLKAACKADRSQHFSVLAEQVQADAAGAPLAVRRLMGLKRKKPFQPEVLPELSKSDGSLCQTPLEIQTRWREHFTQQEDGIEVCPQDLVSFAENQPLGPLPSSLEELPTPMDLLQAILGAQCGKAVGPDGIPSEVGHADPCHMLDLLLPLMCKIGLTGIEPIGFKSGVLAKLYKGKGPNTTCSSFRAIMLLPVLAKILHKAFRPSLYQVFETNALPAQLGGRKRTSVVLGSHYTRAFGRWCRHLGQSAVTLFADVASAYYCAVRGLTARRPTRCDHQAGGEADTAGREDVEEQLRLPSALARADATPWLEALTAEFNDRTWMYLAGDCQPVLTRKGSRPGSSWADLFYGVTVPRIIALRDEMRQDYEGVPKRWTIRWDGLRDLSVPSANQEDWIEEAVLDDVIWADDLAKCIPVQHADDVAPTVAREAGILSDAFAAHGYTLSFGPAKTAAIVSLRGPNSRRARRLLFHGKATVAVLQEEGGTASLPLVPDYRHLGVKVAAEGGIMCEIKHRAAQAWAAFRQGRTRVFRSKRIALAKRGALLSTHVMTKLLFAAGSWPPLSKGEHAVFSSAVLSLYRQTLVIGPDGDQHLTHATVCALLQQPAPEVLLLVERARYMIQLLQAAPTQLWALLRRDPAYIAHLRQTMVWLFGWLRGTTNLPDPSSDWGPWQSLIENRPSLFKAYVKRARGLELARTAGFAAFQALRRAIVVFLDGAAAIEEPARCQYREGCLQCRIAFPTRTAWACHASKVHGYRTAATLLAADVERPVCAACGKLFASKGRLQRHLQASARCRQSWGSFTLDASGAQASDLHCQAPPDQLPGRPGGVTFAHDPAAVHFGLLRELQEVDTEVCEGLWDIVCSYIAPLDVLRLTVTTWCEQPGAHQDAANVRTQAEDLILLLDVDLWCEDFRAPRGPKTAQDCCPPLAEIRDARFCFVLSGVVQTFTIESPPSHTFCYTLFVAASHCPMPAAPFCGSKPHVTRLELPCRLRKPRRYPSGPPRLHWPCLSPLQAGCYREAFWLLVMA